MNDWQSLPGMFFAQANSLGDRPFLWSKQDGPYQAQSWAEVAEKITALARGLLQLGVKPGDRVVLVSENRPMWLIADIAIMAIGAITTPAYITNTEEDHLHILEDSGAIGAIVSNTKLGRTLIGAAHRAGHANFIIVDNLPDVEQSLSVDLLLMGDVMERGQVGLQNIAEQAGEQKPDDTACIIYTSGTGGTPKGVMLSHKAMLHNCAGTKDALKSLFGDEPEIFLSFLPLSHSYEHTVGQFFPIFIGAEIYYAEGIETLFSNMAEARPTIMTAVPRLYETMHARISRGVERAGSFKARLFSAAVRLGTRRHLEPHSLSAGDKIKNALLDVMVRKKIKASFGGRLKALISGGAPLNYDIGMFFTALGLRLLQGYGQTETAPVVSVNRPSKIKMQTVGPALLNTKIKIAPDGEILVAGDLVMQGYWNNQVATDEVIKDGWVHTGDIGELDTDGYLTITDRKKDIIVNSGGDNISPQRVEGIISLVPEIMQAMVVGDKRPHLVALLVPDADWLGEWTEANAKPNNLAELAGDEDLHKAMMPVMERINEQLSNIERVRRFAITAAPFTIDNEQLTPSMKVRRHKILEQYGETLERLYG